MRNLRIVDVTDFYSERGGVRAHLELKGQVLCQLGHAHTVIAPGPRDAIQDRTEGHERSAGGGSQRVVRIKGPALPYDANYHLMWRTHMVRETVARARPHVIEINSPYLAAWALRKVKPDCDGIKTFWWHSDFIGTWVGVLRGAARAKRALSALAQSAIDRMSDASWSLVRHMLQTYSAIFCASRGQADKLRAQGVNRVVLLPFGIDRRIFHPDAHDDAFRHDVFRRAGASRASPIFVAVGRFAVEKRWDVIIEAFLAFRERHPGILVAFGDGPERARLAAKLRHRSDVQFMGFEPDQKKLAAAMASADIFVHACPFETFGLGVAQAIACGRPLVVPDEGGAAEQVDESFAERFESGDARACSAAMERILARDPHSLRDAAYLAGTRALDVRDQVRRTVDIYRDLLHTQPTERAHHAHPRLLA